MDVITSFKLADQILEEYRSVINKDFDGYRNHVTRMLNFCHYLTPNLSEEDEQKLQIAAAFHDIALWTHDRVDYLVPSYQDCHLWLEKSGFNAWKDTIQIIIDMHHLVGVYNGPHARLAEAFRKADLVDFSFGLIRNGVSPAFVKKVKTAIPNAGFHQSLLRFTVRQLGRNPLDPFPMMRLRNIYKR